MSEVCSPHILPTQAAKLLLTRMQKGLSSIYSNKDIYDILVSK